MPSINNINNGYNVNNKKVSSKLTFEVGEKFTARIVDKGQGNDITVRLSDGWQFIAEYNGPDINVEDLKLVQFQVDGYDNGKLKLKLLKSSASAEDLSDDENFNSIIEKEGLSKEDINILKEMVEHDMSLTKENINLVKGLLQFKGKISGDSQEIKDFINKFLDSRNVNPDSAEGKNIKETLTKFFNEFKMMSDKDIFTFIENKIDFSEDNIKSFEALFKNTIDGNSPKTTIENIVKNINDQINNLSKGETISDFPSEKDIELFNQMTLDRDDNSELSQNIKQNNVVQNPIKATETYVSNDPAKKINVMDLLKTISKDYEQDIKPEEHDEFSQIKDIIGRLDDKSIKKIIEDLQINDNSKVNNLSKEASKIIEMSNKGKLEDILSRTENRQVKLTDSEYKKIVTALKEELTNSASAAKETTTTTVNNTVKNLLRADYKSIKSDIQNQINDVKDSVKNIIKHLQSDSQIADKITTMIKQNINDIKVFNSVNDQYYYMNFPVKTEAREYPCRLIIKDKRKDGKKIDKTNARMIVTIDTAHMGKIDSFVVINKNKLDVNIKCEPDFVRTISKKKNDLINGLSKLGLSVNVSVNPKEEETDITNCRKFFNDFTISVIDTMV